MMTEEPVTPTSSTRWPSWRLIGIVNVAKDDGTIRTTFGIIVQDGTARLRSPVVIVDMNLQDTSMGDYLGSLNVADTNQWNEKINAEDEEPDM
jgi:hypothetical protein